MKQEDAEKLAREIKRRSDISYKGADVEELCDYILSGDMRREIENAAFERAAQAVESITYVRGSDPNPVSTVNRMMETAARIVRGLITPAKTADTEG